MVLGDPVLHLVALSRVQGWIGVPAALPLMAAMHPQPWRPRAGSCAWPGLAAALRLHLLDRAAADAGPHQQPLSLGEGACSAAIACGFDTTSFAVLVGRWGWGPCTAGRDVGEGGRTLHCEPQARSCAYAREPMRMLICKYMDAHAHLYACTCAQTHMVIGLHALMCIHKCELAHISICIHAHVHRHTWSYAHMCLYVHT